MKYNMEKSHPGFLMIQEYKEEQFGCSLHSVLLYDFILASQIFEKINPGPTRDKLHR